MAEGNDPRYEAREDKKEAFTRIFKTGMEDTQKQARALIRGDADIKKLAEQVKKTPTPEAISRFVAGAESKMEKFTYDLANWSGNNFFDHGDGNHLVKTDKFVQLGCIGEAAHAGSIVMALKEEGFLPADTTWEYVTNGSHWAPVIFQEKDAKGSMPGFIIDTWLVETGTAAPTFASEKDWRKGVMLLGESDLSETAQHKKGFYAAIPGLQSSGVVADGSLVENLWTKRTFDSGFMVEWQKKHDSEKVRVLYDGSYNDKGNHEAAQDLLTVKYYLGDKPKLSPELMKDDFFASLRDRMAHVIEKDKDNTALKASGITAADVRKAKNFVELKSAATKFYKAYGALDYAFEPAMSPDKVESFIRNWADLNGDKKVDFGESVVLAEKLRASLKDTPGAMAVFSKMEWKDISVDELLSSVKAGMAVKKPEGPKR